MNVYIEMIDSRPVPDVPTLLFVPDGSGMTGDSWIKYEKDYAANLSNVKLVELSCKHDVYHEKPEEIIKEMEEFISSF